MNGSKFESKYGLTIYILIRLYNHHTTTTIDHQINSNSLDFTVGGECGTKGYLSSVFGHVSVNTASRHQCILFKPLLVVTNVMYNTCTHLRRMRASAVHEVGCTGTANSTTHYPSYAQMMPLASISTMHVLW